MCVTLNIHRIYDFLQTMIFIILSIISMNQKNRNIFWQKYFLCFSLSILRKVYLNFFFTYALSWIISYFLSGLTRSRPDILADSFVSAFNSPANIPKESIGSFLELNWRRGRWSGSSRKYPRIKQTIATQQSQRLLKICRETGSCF